jgi:hypothetical protein
VTKDKWADSPAALAVTPWANCRYLEWIILKGELVPQKKIHTNDHIENIEIDDT